MLTEAHTVRPQCVVDEIKHVSCSAPAVRPATGIRVCLQNVHPMRMCERLIITRCPVHDPSMLIYELIMQKLHEQDKNLDKGYRATYVVFIAQSTTFWMMTDDIPKQSVLRTVSTIASVAIDK